MIATTEERSIFENEEWLVAESGLEHKKTGYFIARDSVASRRDDGLWAWPLHMAEKQWCTALPFTEAFSCAVTAYGFEANMDLARTFAVACSEIASWPEHGKGLSQLSRMSSVALLKGSGVPISVNEKSAENLENIGVLRLSGVRQTTPDRTIKSPYSGSKRPRLSSLSMLKAAGLHWRAPRRFRGTGTKLVRLFQATWSLW